MTSRPDPDIDPADARRVAEHIAAHRPATRCGDPVKPPETIAAEVTEYRTRPCAGTGRVCPWRTDADLTAFSDADMDRLVRAGGGDTAPGAHSLDDVERMAAAPQMACHRDQPDTAHSLRLCAGWLAVVGPHHLLTRMSVLSGRLPRAAVEPDTSGWPPLHASLGALLACRRAQLAARQQRPHPQPGTTECEKPT
ncbi:DUF6283 family protein [Streptosporangium canum]|uniref:DUF6283 family protein n=1 Tax=Streptosporangium canum TaxID=324952 RepID=UPI00378A929C